MSASLALQTAIRERLVSTAAVTSLVPASSIFDRNERPIAFPSIVLGESQTVDETVDHARRRVRVYSTLHIWTREPGLAQVQAAVWNVRQALHFDRLHLASPHGVINLRVSDARVMRDPDGTTGHGVLTVEALIAELQT